MQVMMTDRAAPLCLINLRNNSAKKAKGSQRCEVG